MLDEYFSRPEVQKKVKMSKNLKIRLKIFPRKDGKQSPAQHNFVRTTGTGKPTKRLRRQSKFLILIFETTKMTVKNSKDRYEELRKNGQINLSLFTKVTDTKNLSRESVRKRKMGM